MITCSSCGSVEFGEAPLCGECAGAALAPTLARAGQGLEPALGRGTVTPNVTPEDDLARRIAEAGDGATLVLAPGRYVLPGAIAVSGRLTLLGAGADRTEIVCGGPAPQAAGVVFFGGSQPDRRGTLQVPVGGALEVRDVSLTSGVAGPHTLAIARGGMLELVGCRLDAGCPPRPSEGGLVVKSSQGYGVRAEACSRVALVGCTIRHADDSGVHIADEAALLAVECRALDNGWAGFFIGDRARAELVGCVASGNANGVSIQEQAIARVMRSRAEANRGMGIGAYTRGRVHVQDTVLSRNEGRGLYLSNAGRADIVGNLVDRNALGGIEVSGGVKHVRLEVNRVSANGESGVSIAEGGEAVVRGNWIDGHAVALDAAGATCERNRLEAAPAPLPERWPPEAVVPASPAMPKTARQEAPAVPAAPVEPPPARAERPLGDRRGPGRDRLAEARRLEAAGDLAEALKAYRDAASTPGRSAELAVTAWLQVGRLLVASPPLASAIWRRSGCTDPGPRGAAFYFGTATREARQIADATYRFWERADMAVAAAVATALPRVRRAAEAGDPWACYQLGAIMADGVGVPLHPTGARDWLRRAGTDAGGGIAAALLALELAALDDAPAYDEDDEFDGGPSLQGPGLDARLAAYAALALERNAADPPDRPLPARDPLWDGLARRCAASPVESRGPNDWQDPRRPYLLVKGGHDGGPVALTVRGKPLPAPDSPRGSGRRSGIMEGASWGDKNALRLTLMRHGLPEEHFGYAWAIVMVAMGRQGTYQQETRVGRDWPVQTRRRVERAVAAWWEPAAASGLAPDRAEAAWAEVHAPVVDSVGDRPAPPLGSFIDPRHWLRALAPVPPARPFPVTTSGWQAADYDLAPLLAAFPPLALKPGYMLRAFAHVGENGCDDAIVLGVPDGADLGAIAAALPPASSLPRRSGPVTRGVPAERPQLSGSDWRALGASEALHALGVHGDPLVALKDRPEPAARLAASRFARLLDLYVTPLWNGFAANDQLVPLAGKPGRKAVPDEEPAPVDCPQAPADADDAERNVYAARSWFWDNQRPRAHLNARAWGWTEPRPVRWDPALTGADTVTWYAHDTVAPPGGSGICPEVIVRVEDVFSGEGMAFRSTSTIVAREDAGDD